MAIEVEMSSDIRKFEPKFIGFFTLRQTITVGISAICFFPIMKIVSFFTGDMSISNRLFITLLCIMPIAACGWIKMDGCPLEMLICRLLYKFFLTPQHRVAKRVNSYRAWERKEEQIKMSKMSEAQRKKYIEKKENKKIKYSQKNLEYRVYH